MAWQTVLKRRAVEKRTLSRKVVDLGMPVALAREIINTLDTSEVKKYGRMIEVMKDETIKKAIDMYLKKRQEADKCLLWKEPLLLGKNILQLLPKRQEPILDTFCIY